MKKDFRYWAIIAITTLSYVFCSCSNKDDIDTAIFDEGYTEIPKVLTKKDVAEMLSSMPLSQEICQEVFNQVKKSLHSGHDEMFNLSELNKVEHYCKITSSLLATKMANSLPTRNTSSPASNNSMNINSITDSNVTIYWPYSENWDGEEAPVIVEAPGDDIGSDEDDHCVAMLYNKNTGTTEYKIIDEEYARVHPVWVINENIKNYVDEEDSSYNSPSDSNNSGSSTDSNNSNNTDEYVYEWVLESMKVTKQYDRWWNGGSEFRIRIVFPSGAGQSPITENRTTISFTRDEITKETIKQVGFILNTNFRKEQINNGVVITELDWSDRQVKLPTISLKYKVNDSIVVEDDVALKIGNNDDEIIYEPYDRSALLTQTYTEIKNGKNDVVLKTKINKKKVIL